MPQQRLNKIAATDHVHFAVLLLDASYLLGKLSLYQSGIVPFESAAAAGGYILGCVLSLSAISLLFVALGQYAAKMS